MQAAIPTARISGMRRIGICLEPGYSPEAAMTRGRAARGSTRRFEARGLN